MDFCLHWQAHVQGTFSLLAGMGQFSLSHPPGLLNVVLYKPGTEMSLLELLELD